MNIRKAVWDDLDAVVGIYDEIHTAEESGKATVGWIRGVYPVRATAEAALERDDLFVLEDEGEIRGVGIINQVQVDAYAQGQWKYDVPDDEVCVCHTLIISPCWAGKGYGRKFIDFYVNYAKEQGWNELRFDTNARNENARRLYHRLGFEEIGIVPTTFNGIPGVDLVLFEKNLE